VISAKLHHHPLIHGIDTRHSTHRGKVCKWPLALLTGDEGKRAGSITSRQKACEGGLGMKKQARVDQGQSKMGENGKACLLGL